MIGFKKTKTKVPCRNYMENYSATIQVNKFARRSRHFKIFHGGNLIAFHLGYLVSDTLGAIKSLGKMPLIVRIGHFLKELKLFFRDVLTLAPRKKLLLQAGVLAAAWLTVTALSPSATFSPATLSYSNDYIAAYSVPGDILVADEEGYLIKINPQTNQSNRIGLTDFAAHTVDKGETLSEIAKQYGVKVETVMWQNNIANANSLRIGQSILVPPVDGISYKVGSGDNLEKIAKKYKISSESIIAQNGLTDAAIQKGQALFLPGAKPLVSNINIAGARDGAISRGGTRTIDGTPSNATPVSGKVFIYPTIGKVTQGFKGGHYALDIADSSKPAIWAAGGGTVEKVSTGTWGGGYGNHVIINHGDGLKTLYGHMDSVNVYEGQYVNQGDVIGIMGNTGRVYGKTGIHVHFEVIDNGVKKNPWNYM